MLTAFTALAAPLASCAAGCWAGGKSVSVVAARAQTLPEKQRGSGTSGGTSRQGTTARRPDCRARAASDALDSATPIPTFMPPTSTFQPPPPCRCTFDTWWGAALAGRRAGYPTSASSRCISWAGTVGAAQWRWWGRRNGQAVDGAARGAAPARAPPSPADEIA